MKYTKYEMGSYNLHIINTDKFKTVNMRIMFKEKSVKEKVNFRNFLSYILLEGSNKYKTKRDLQLKCEDLYALAIDSRSIISGNYSLLSFDSTFLNDKYTEDGLFKQVFEFIWELISNPKITDNAFDNENFNIVKESIISELKSIEEMPDYYSELELFKLVGKDTPISYCDEGDINTIDKVNVKNLYEYYLDVLKTNKLDIFVVGEVKDTEIKKIIENTVTINTFKKQSSSHYIEHKDFRKRVQIKKDSANYKQSKLLIGYKIDKLTDFEKQYVMPCYNYILGGSADSKLFKTIREEKSLCYNVSSRYITLGNLLVLKAGINKDNYKTTVNLMRKKVKELEKGEFSSDDVLKAHSIMLNSYQELQDSPASIIAMYMLHEYLDKDLVDDRIKNIKKVTKEMIVTVAKKIHIDTIYFLEGKNDKKN